MMAKTGKPQTYRDVLDALTAQCVILPVELLEKIDASINGNKQLSCVSRAELIEKAVEAFLKSQRS
jgi:metal-responsive CopG/Arc/MetJ family transcriptional regulator